MKTPEEIKRAFEQCTQLNGCAGCPYSGMRCTVEVSRDAIAYIKQLEDDRKERDILADAYQELETNQPKWISVKDRLPEELTDVVAYIRAGETSWTEIAHRLETRWIRKGVPIDNVTHWMPLPEPPKEDCNAD